MGCGPASTLGIAHTVHGQRAGQGRAAGQSSGAGHITRPSSLKCMETPSQSGLTEGTARGTDRVQAIRVNTGLLVLFSVDAQFLLVEGEGRARVNLILFWPAGLCSKVCVDGDIRRSAPRTTVGGNAKNPSEGMPKPRRRECPTR